MFGHVGLQDEDFGARWKAIFEFEQFKGCPLKNW